MPELSAGGWLYIALSMTIVAIIAIRSRASTLLLSLVTAAVMITLFNLQSPFQASYLSLFALEVFIVWAIYIAIIRAIFGKRRQSSASAVGDAPPQ